jgi:hypothetical protein
MRFLRRLEKRLAQAALFGLVDRWLARRLRPEDAVVISGFWRSGTTFLLEELARRLRARSVFEPLHHRARGARPFHAAHCRFEARGRSMTEVYPYVPPGAPSHPIDGFLADVLTGRVTAPWTRKARSAGSLLRSRLIVKLVRGNLLAAYLERRFGCRTVLLVRHPAAIVASLRRGESNLRILSSEEFLSLLLADERLRGDHLRAQEEAIERWRRSPLSRLALAWAITHHVPLSQLARGEHHPLIVRYEELMLRPEATLRELAARLGGHENLLPAPPGGEPPPAPQVPRDSLTTKRAREGVALRERAFGWKRELAPPEADTVRAVCAAFGPPLTTLVDQIEELDGISRPDGISGLDGLSRPDGISGLDGLSNPDGGATGSLAP